jgi:hypothetical protein
VEYKSPGDGYSGRNASRVHRGGRLASYDQGGESTWQITNLRVREASELVHCMLYRAKNLNRLFFVIQKRRVLVTEYQIYERDIELNLVALSTKIPHARQGRKHVIVVRTRNGRQR